MIVQEYVKHYSDYDRSVGRSTDLAAVDLAKTVNVKQAFEELVQLLPGPGDKAKHQKLLLAHWYAQTYKDDQFVDLADLCDQIKVQFADTPTSPHQRAAMSSTRFSLETSAASSSPDAAASPCQYSYGLSIYFPWAVVSPEYVRPHIRESPGGRWHRLARVSRGAHHRHPT